MGNPFMARAIELSIENVHSGRGGSFGAVIVKAGAMIAEAVKQVRRRRTHSACRNSCHPCSLRDTWRLRAARLRDLRFVRALPDVPGSNLLGPALPHLLCQRRHRRIADRL